MSRTVVKQLINPILKILGSLLDLSLIIFLMFFALFVIYIHQHMPNYPFKIFHHILPFSLSSNLGTNCCPHTRSLWHVLSEIDTKKGLPPQSFLATMPTVSLQCSASYCLPLGVQRVRLCAQNKVSFHFVSVSTLVQHCVSSVY